MKKIATTVYAVIVMGLVGAVSISAANTNDGVKPYSGEFSRLSQYLQLDNEQSQSVYNINEFFKSQSDNIEVTSAKALKQNLQLMKSTLSEEQYRKYLTLLNVTANNQNANKAALASEADSNRLMASNE